MLEQAKTTDLYRKITQSYPRMSFLYPTAFAYRQRRSSCPLWTQIILEQAPT